MHGDINIVKIKHKTQGYSLNDLTLWVLGIVLFYGSIIWIEQGFFKTFISTLFLLAVLYLLMKNKQITYLYKLPIFLFIILGLVQRTFSLIADPESYAFDFTINLTDSMLAGTLAYTALMLTILLIFFWIEFYFKNGYKSPIKILLPPKSTKLLIVSTNYYLLSIIVTSYLGIAYNVGMQGGEASTLGYLIRIFDIEIGFKLTLLLFIYCYPITNKWQKYFILTLLLLGLSYTVFRGSRSGILGIVICSWFAIIAIQPQFLIKKKYILTCCIILIGIGFPLFYIALAFRIMHLNQVNINIFNIIHDTSIFSMFNQISARLGELDLLSAVLYQLQLYDYSEFVTILGILDVTIKGLVPSFLYKASLYSIDQVFPYVFRGIPLDIVHGEHWTGLGTFIAFCGIYFAPFFMAIYMYITIRIGQMLFNHIKYEQVRYILGVNVSYSFFYPTITAGSFSGVLPNFIRILIIFFILWTLSKIRLNIKNFYYPLIKKM